MNWTVDELPIWYRYSDGIGHITSYDDNSFMSEKGRPAFERSLCGQKNRLSLDEIDSDEPQCKMCQAVLTMLELAE